MRACYKILSFQPKPEHFDDCSNPRRGYEHSRYSLPEIGYAKERAVVTAYARYSVCKTVRLRNSATYDLNLITISKHIKICREIQDRWFYSRAFSLG